MSRGLRRTLGTEFVRRLGWRKVPGVMDVLAEWAWQLHERGRNPTVEELVEASGRSRAQIYRDLESFREAWPEEESPERIARATLEVVLRFGLAEDGLSPELLVELMGVEW